MQDNERIIHSLKMETVGRCSKWKNPGQPKRHHPCDVYVAESTRAKPSTSATTESVSQNCLVTREVRLGSDFPEVETMNSCLHYGNYKEVIIW